MKTKMQSERSKKPELSAAMKDEHQKHREQFDVSREPLLGGLTSEFDLKMFRDAQMLACEQLVCLLSHIASMQCDFRFDLFFSFSFPVIFSF